jgi:hypothetical protein
MEPKALNEMLQNNTKIGETQTLVRQEATYIIDTSDINTRANFVFLKLGASGYKYFSQKENTIFIEQSKVCEDNHVPWGAYFYSTSITKEEADQELNFILEKFGELDTTKYCFAFMLDIENSGSESDRLNNAQNLSRVQGYLLNRLEEELGIPVVFYTYPHMIGDGNINFEEMFQELPNDKTIKLALSALRQPDGEHSEYTQNVIDSLPENVELVMEQAVIDVEFGAYTIDANIMTESYYDEIITAMIERENNNLSLMNEKEKGGEEEER